MFCRNCGTPLQYDSHFCTSCGAPAGAGNTHCPNCGSVCDTDAFVCIHCGVRLNPPQATPPGIVQKSKLVAALLAFFLGAFGVHNFYLGYKNKALAQLLISLLTCGVGAIAIEIWAFVEFIQILTGSISVDANGYPLKSDV